MADVIGLPEKVDYNAACALLTQLIEDEQNAPASTCALAEVQEWRLTHLLQTQRTLRPDDEQGCLKIARYARFRWGEERFLSVWRRLEEAA